MYKWDALAGDAAVPPAGTGFRGFSLSHIVESAESVDALLDIATQAGGRIVRRAPAASGDSYRAYFTDPDGYLWQVAARNFS